MHALRYLAKIFSSFLQNWKKQATHSLSFFKKELRVSTIIGRAAKEALM